MRNIQEFLKIFSRNLRRVLERLNVDFEKLQEYAKTRTNPYGLSFEEVCAEVMGAKQKEQLRRMIGFTFKRHPSINFPEEHLQALEKLLEIRVRKLLAIPTRSRAARQKEGVER